MGSKYQAALFAAVYCSGTGKLYTVHTDGMGGLPLEIECTDYRMATAMVRTIRDMAMEVVKPVSTTIVKPAPVGDVVIKKAVVMNTYRQGKIPADFELADMVRILGFKPQRNPDGPGGKVKYQWEFTANGRECSIWDYYDARWSIYDPWRVLVKLFPGIKYGV